MTVYAEKHSHTSWRIRRSFAVVVRQFFGLLADFDVFKI